MHHNVDGERLRTTFAEIPTVQMWSSNERNTVSIEFDSSLIDSNGNNWATVISFVHVIDFRFTDFDLGPSLSNEADYDFALIEIDDSDQIRSLVSSGSLDRPAMPAEKPRIYIIIGSHSTTMVLTTLYALSCQ